MPSQSQLQTISQLGSGLTNIAPGTGPAAPFVAAGGAILSAIGSLVPPRGNYAKFQRTAFPVMLAQAQSSGLPVLMQWFEGEVVGVSPTGQFGVVDSWNDNHIKTTSYIGNSNYASEWQNLPWVKRNKAQGSFIAGICIRSDGDCVNQPNSIMFKMVEGDTIVSGITSNLSGIMQWLRGNPEFAVIGLLFLAVLIFEKK